MVVEALAALDGARAWARRHVAPAALPQLEEHHTRLERVLLVLAAALDGRTPQPEPEPEPELQPLEPEPELQPELQPAVSGREAELAAALEALQHERSAERAAWAADRAEGLALVQRLQRELAVAAEAEERAEGAAAAAMAVSAGLRRTVKKGARRLAHAEARALEYGAEVGALGQSLRKLEEQCRAKDDMLAAYEVRLRALSAPQPQLAPLQPQPEPQEASGPTPAPALPRREPEARPKSPPGPPPLAARAPDGAAGTEAGQLRELEQARRRAAALEEEVGRLRRLQDARRYHASAAAADEASLLHSASLLDGTA